MEERRNDQETSKEMENSHVFCVFQLAVLKVSKWVQTFSNKYFLKIV